MSISIVKGSLTDVSKLHGGSLAESFLSADVIVVLDVSGSMANDDARGGRMRFDVAVEELTSLQERLPGKIAVIQFSDSPLFVPGGKPVFLFGSTNLASALKFVLPADGCVQFIVISDGQPDSEQSALTTAAKFTSKIDCIYIGPEDGDGADFLRRLAAASGGRYATADRAHELARTVERLMLKGG